MKISIIIPVLNDSHALAALLPSLANSSAEIIVVDGGSTKLPQELVEQYGARLVTSAAGRATQMNVGAKQATGDVLLFLHADSQLPDSFESAIQSGMEAGREWGRFDVQLSGQHPMLRVVEWMMNQRSRLTGVCTGDQGIFLTKNAFENVGGYPEIPLMEDIELSVRLKAAPYCIRQKLVTSSRRWEEKGVYQTIWLMWSLRLRYFFGASPESLVQRYYG
jgi:rSAM/selenodomain-associated transferase 2